MHTIREIRFEDDLTDTSARRARMEVARKNDWGQMMSKDGEGE